MKKPAFTMIELIFVIVIIGILAAVALPKFMATRDDAKMTVKVEEIMSAFQEIPAYVLSQAKVEDNITKMSQVLQQLEFKGYAEDYNASGSAYTYIKTEDNNGNLENCIEFNITNDRLYLQYINTATGRICKGIQKQIMEMNITLKGLEVKH